MAEKITHWWPSKRGTPNPQ